MKKYKRNMSQNDINSLFSKNNIKHKVAFAVFLFFGVQFWRESSSFFKKWSRKRKHGSYNPFKFVIPGILGTMMVGFSIDFLFCKTIQQ